MDNEQLAMNNEHVATIPAPMDDVPPGYKRTEVGVIPEDWEVKSLSGIGSFSKGRGIKRNDVTDEGVACIRYGEIYTRYNNYVSTPMSRIPQTVAAMALPIMKGDLLFAGSGETAEEIGKCVAYIGEEEAYAGGDIVVLRPFRHNAVYLGHLLNHDLIVQQKARFGQGDAVVHISARNLAMIKLPLPPKREEQDAIAAALSDVDALLRSLDALIAKKRAVKQATMQQLLTGTTRLPGFSGEWTIARLGNVCQITTGRKDVNEGNSDGQFPFFTCSKTHTHSDSYSFIGEAILIAGNGDVGHLHYYNGKFEAYQRTYVLQQFTTNVKYLWYQLEAFLAKSLGIGIIGSSIPYIKLENLVGFELHRPVDPHEQTAIAAVLADMDAEIAALEAQRDKTQQIKQGMMQQLLTGRIRLR